MDLSLPFCCWIYPWLPLILFLESFYFSVSFPRDMNWYLFDFFANWFFFIIGPKPSDLYGKYTWKIEKFSQINKRELRSNAFEVGGYKWYGFAYSCFLMLCLHFVHFMHLACWKSVSHETVALCLSLLLWLTGTF